MPLLLLFVLVPILELYAINGVADGIGWGWTLFLLFADSVLGAVLVKREGRRAWEKFRAAIGEARWPGDEVAQGALVLIGGALLLTPGFLTDLVGLAMVVPFTRAVIAGVVKARIVPVPVQMGGAAYNRMRGHQARGADPQRPEGDVPPSGDGPRVMDVEVVSVERDEPDALG